MKRKLFKSILTASAVAMICACGDDSASSNPATPIADNACAKAVVTADAWIFNTGVVDVVIYTDGNVTDAAGQPYGYYDSATGVVMDLNGSPIATGVDVANLTACAANATINPNTGTIEKFSSSSEATDPNNPTSSAENNGQNPSDPTSSAGGTNPTSSAGSNPTDPTSSAGTEPVENSSSSVEPVKPSGNPEEDIKKYPVAAYKNLLAEGSTQKGWNSRYWDSCKPHCSWMDNVDTSSQAAYAAAGYTVRNCNIHDVEIPTFTLSKGLERYWWGMEGVPSSCEVGAGGSFTCTDMAPIRVNDTLSYGFVAGPSNQGCGKCYHLQYDGSTSNMGDGGPDVKDTHKALKGKHMIVMASNIGHDVDASSTQFDLLVPGGGVGIFNALSTQIGKTPEELGSNNGGVLSYCMQKLGYWQVTKEQYQECVIEKCEAVFDSTVWPHLNRGCKWLATFFEAADNPSFVWEEVECPQYLVDKYRTTLSLELETNILYSEKWDNYKGDGQFITTDACSRTANAQGEHCDPDQLAADKAKSY
ncbi:glycosyl hydrolase family 5 [Fibrobacter sp.]|uniref:glycosyl hydrolase family 5 n=1 Tax=Fibrobacter sp. TaxID=35828 RepID=UPI00386EBA92